MLFNSIPFFVFFLIVFVIYFLMSGKWRWTVLLAASSYFYMAFIPVYILILASIILVDYFAAIKMEAAVSVRRRNLFYYLALFANLGILVFFKYFNFLNENITAVLAAANISNPVHFIKLILPLGISFSTFQSMAYLVDVKNGKIKAERHMGIYALFIMFFPHISSGPIAKPGWLLPQFHKTNRLNAADLSIGFSQVLLGLFKKVVVGDMLGNYVDIFYGSYESYSGFATIFTCWIFLCQLYADFSRNPRRRRQAAHESVRRHARESGGAPQRETRGRPGVHRLARVSGRTDRDRRLQDRRRAAVLSERG
jgi:D-alanyl-lipoteichoic acid acyltransferase DltB (MBOAT superfamily)